MNYYKRPDKKKDISNQLDNTNKMHIKRDYMLINNNITL